MKTQEIGQPGRRPAAEPNPRTLRTSVAQAILEAMLATPEGTFGNGLKLRLLISARRYLIRRGDPLVRYRLEGRELALPLSHELPVIRKNAPQYSSNLGRIAAHVADAYTDCTLVDVGANIGDSLAIVRAQGHFPALCIEGEDRFFSLLQRNATVLGDDIELEHAFVGCGSGTIGGSVQVERGTARVVTDETGRKSVRGKSLSGILAEHPRFARPRMIKLDTDGMDCDILTSELDMLARVGPVLFLEYVPDWISPPEERLRFFARLREIGYRCALVYENNGDYLLTADLADARLLEDIIAFYVGRGDYRYCDLCIFHRNHGRLADEVRRSEQRFFEGFRFQNEP